MSESGKRNETKYEEMQEQNIPKYDAIYDKAEKLRKELDNDCNIGLNAPNSHTHCTGCFLRETLGAEQPQTRSGRIYNEVIPTWQLPPHFSNYPQKASNGS